MSLASRLKLRSRSYSDTFRGNVSLVLALVVVGAMTAATPKTSASLAAVRTHTIVSFFFNAFVIAMVISLLTGLVGTIS